MNLKIYENTVSLLNPNETTILNEFAPFVLKIDPSEARPTPSEGSKYEIKINKIVYDWGDGNIEEQRFFPSGFNAPVETNINREIGDPLNYIKTHTYSLSTTYENVFDVKIYIYQFTVKNPIVYNYKLNLKAPKLDASKTGFFKNMHLIYTKMFGVNNRMLYIFEGKEPTWTFPVVMEWRKKNSEDPPILGEDYLVF